jgi:hypothetical protein
VISSETGILKTLSDLRTVYPEFVLGGSAALHHLGFLGRVPNDLDLILPRHDGRLRNVLKFPEFTVKVYEPIMVNDWKVDAMSIKPVWKVSSYWDHWLQCRVQLPHQIVWVLEHVLREGMTASPEKRAGDLEAMEDLKRRVYASI